MIVSVPHTGTRSLRDYLCEKRGVSWRAEDENYDPGMTCYHVGEHDKDLAQFNGELDVPLRDPFDVAISWEARYPYGLFPELELWDKLIAICARSVVRFHVMERIPLDVGEHPEHWARSKRKRKQALELPRVKALRAWIPERLEFFAPHYESFWWLTK